MKRCLMLVVICLLTISVSQAQEHQAAIKKQFEEINQMGEMDPEDMDPDLMLKYTYPPLIQLFGGKDKYIALIKQSMTMEEDYEEEDDYYEDEEEGSWTLRESVTEVGQIGPVYKQSNELQAVVEVKEIDRYDERDDIIYSYKLAISRDNGNFWYFIDDTLKWSQVVPDLHPSIVQKEEREETIFK